MENKKGKKGLMYVAIGVIALVLVLVIGYLIYQNADKEKEVEQALSNLSSQYKLTNVDASLQGETAFGSRDLSYSNAAYHKYDLFAINEEGKKLSLGTFDLDERNIDFYNESSSDTQPQFIGVFNSRVYFIIMYHSSTAKGVGRFNVYSIDLKTYNNVTNSFDSMRAEYEKINLNFSDNSYNRYVGLIGYDMIFESCKDLNNDGFAETKYYSSLNIDTGKTRTLLEKATNVSFYKNGYVFYIDESGEKIYSLSLITKEEKEIFDAKAYITDFYIDGDTLTYETGINYNPGVSYSTAEGTYKITDIDLESETNKYETDDKKLLLNNVEIYKADNEIEILANADNNVMFVSGTEGDLNLYKYNKENRKVESIKNFFINDYNDKYFGTNLEYVKEYN